MNKTKTHLIFSILGNIIKCSDVQFEFATLAEFAEASAQADEVRSGNRDA